MKISILAAIIGCSLWAFSLGKTHAQSVVISEVLYNPVGSNERVKLTNTTGGAINVGSWWFCAKVMYRQLSSATVSVVNGNLNIPAGGSVTVEFTTTYLNNSASDLSLYTSSGFSSCLNIVDFVQWGGSFDFPSGRENVAVDACLWEDEQFVATAPAGQALHFDGTNTGGVCTGCGNNGSTLTVVGDLFNATTTLPVELKEFSVVQRRHSNLVQWSTASELNTLFFNIEKSFDGIAFNSIGEVPATGFSDVPQYYTFEDFDADHSLVYYRLKYVDRDGAFGYSQLIFAGRRDVSKSIQIEAVNLISRSQELTVSLLNELPNLALHFELYNATGQSVLSVHLNPDIGSSTVCFSTDVLMSGWHILVAIVDGVVIQAAPVIAIR